MNNKTVAEFLREPETVCQPDPRNRHFGASPEGKGLEDHHRAIAAITLHDDVPEDIVVKFETAKNLYLYAWFVYRFFPVAQSQVYACLEFALHQRFEQEMLKTGWTGERNKKQKKRRHGFGLAEYLEFAGEKEHLSNDDFEAWRLQVQERARHRHSVESIEEMERLGLTEMNVDEVAIEVSEEDRAFDYASDLFKSMVNLRNHYAHGGNSLHSQVLGTFRVAAEIINKVWSERGEIP